MTQSTIKFSQLEDRIDAEYYKPEFLADLELFRGSQFPKEPIRELSKSVINFGAYSLCNYIYWVDKGIPFLNVKDIKENDVDWSDVKHISSEVHEILHKAKVKSKQVLLTMAGTLGIAAVAPENLGECNSNQAIAKISIKEGAINPFFLSTFLNSRFGKLQTEREGTGGVQRNINLGQIKTVLVPIPPRSFQKHIENLVKKTHQKREHAEEKYKEAERLLEKELELEDLDLSTQKAYQVDFSEISDRFDSDFYQPKFIKVKELLLEGKYKTVTIGEIASSVKYGTSEKVYYTNQGVPFLRVTDIDSFYTISPEEGKFISLYEAEKLKNYKAKEGDLIISRTGTLGSAIYIGKRLAGSIFGSYFIKIRFEDERLDPSFVAFFLNSKAGKLQSERLGSGGIQTNLTIDAIKSLIIPILPKFTQQKISKLVQQSFKLRKESKALIEKAKRKVEEMIEKSTK